ncbi:MAG: hypothetical protein COB65_02325 [Thalassobium sp.]|nr:MAG: hypothetical protein COB65_02325 [Thalassobium sp.]
MTMPNLFLIAAPRAGSTQLARWLATHPDISLSLVKEPNFFAAHEFDPAYVSASHLDDVDPTKPVTRPTQFAVFRDPARYGALFENMTTRWRMEASTSYLSCPQSPELIAAACPDARVILLHREPVARALSHYQLARRTGRTQASLMDELETEISGQLPCAACYLLRPSLQLPGVARFERIFPKRSTTLQFEAMIKSPQAALAQVARLLDIDPTGFDVTARAQNAGAEPRFAQLNALLMRSGLKTRLRQILPAPVKPYLRRLWFNDNCRAPINAAEIAALKSALEAQCAS